MLALFVMLCFKDWEEIMTKYKYLYYLGGRNECFLHFLYFLKFSEEDNRRAFWEQKGKV